MLEKFNCPQPFMPFTTMDEKRSPFWARIGHKVKSIAPVQDAVASTDRLESPVADRVLVAASRTVSHMDDSVQRPRADLAAALDMYVEKLDDWVECHRLQQR